MQITIDEINKRGFDILLGTYEGGNDQGGFEYAKLIKLGDEQTIEDWLDKYTELTDETYLVGGEVMPVRELNKYDTRINDILHHQDEYSKQWTVKDVDTYSDRICEEIEKVLLNEYGTWCGDFEAQGTFYVTKKGHCYLGGEVTLNEHLDVDLLPETIG
tara:strand:- start:132 stop:608 length:477 start_codon:yes stop_codon:yes gene_type:complete